MADEAPRDNVNTNKLGDLLDDIEAGSSALHKTTPKSSDHMLTDMHTHSLKAAGKTSQDAGQAHRRGCSIRSL